MGDDRMVLQSNMPKIPLLICLTESYLLGRIPTPKGVRIKQASMDSMLVILGQICLGLTLIGVLLLCWRKIILLLPA